MCVLDEIIKTLENEPLVISSTRRGDNGLKNAEENAEKIIVKINLNMGELFAINGYSSVYDEDFSQHTKESLLKAHSNMLKRIHDLSNKLIKKIDIQMLGND